MGVWGLIGLETEYYEGLRGYSFTAKVCSQNYYFVGLFRIKSLWGLEQQLGVLNRVWGRYLEIA